MYSNCLICDRIELIKNNSNPHFVKELSTGYLVLHDFQYYPGYVLFLLKNHHTNLYDLSYKIKQKFLLEMDLVGQAAMKAYSPKKIDYALLGNTIPHLHWHIIPRYTGIDKNTDQPIWSIRKSIRYAKKYLATPQQTDILKVKLLKYL